MIVFLKDTLQKHQLFIGRYTLKLEVTKINLDDKDETLYIGNGVATPGDTIIGSRH